MSDRIADIQSLTNSLLAGDRMALARAITLSESTLEKDRHAAEGILKKVLPSTKQSLRIGITGVPGVGKSTFIEAWGEYLISAHKKIAVLTIDPTSQKTKGSILADKTRMEQLSRHENVFIRPSPSGLALGGVGYRTREAILLCEAAGFDVILVETVGVGQSETEVRGMVDFYLLLMLAGAGDELQGIKKGIMEMADGVVITKADGQNQKPALQAQADAAQALHMQTARSSGWAPKVLTASALENKGMKEVWNMILDYESQSKKSGFFQSNRDEQKEKWFEESVDQLVRTWMQKSFHVEKEKLIKAVLADNLLPIDAARKFLEVVTSDGK